MRLLLNRADQVSIRVRHLPAYPARHPGRDGSNAASVLVTASVAAPTHAAPADSAASTRLDATPAASNVAPNAASAVPVHHAALHQG
jgi:hypothetical protein